MNYSPKLKKAIEQIKAVLKEHDIAGIVFLHTPGHGEYLVHTNPSYSCCEIDEVQGVIRTKAKRADYPSNEAWEDKVTKTANMLDVLTEMSGDIMPPIVQMKQMLDKTVQAEHRGGHTGTNVSQSN